MHTWGVAVLLMVVTWVVLAGLPGAPVQSVAGRLILAAGFLVIGVGFYLLSIGPVDSVQSMKRAPLALVAGFFVIDPVGLLYHRSAPSSEEGAAKKPRV